ADHLIHRTLLRCNEALRVVECCRRRPRLQLAPPIPRDRRRGEPLDARIRHPRRVPQRLPPGTALAADGGRLPHPRLRDARYHVASSDDLGVVACGAYHGRLVARMCSMRSAPYATAGYSSCDVTGMPIACAASMTRFCIRSGSRTYVLTKS